MLKAYVDIEGKIPAKVGDRVALLVTDCAVDRETAVRYEQAIATCRPLLVEGDLLEFEPDVDYLVLRKGQECVIPAELVRLLPNRTVPPTPSLSSAQNEIQMDSQTSTNGA